MIKPVLCLCLWHGLYFSQTDSLYKRKDTLSTIIIAPIFNTTGAGAELSLEQQDISSLLQASRDAFTQFASFQLGAAHYYARGYSAQNQQVMINGINVSEPETGSSSWSNWGGLNDVSRFVETGIGNTANRYAFSGFGGYVNIDSRASSFKKGTRVSYASANATFRNRFMLTHATGNLPHGWSVAFSASNRYGNQVYVPGTYFNASSFYCAVDKRINYKHTLSFTGFSAPVEQGLSAYETKEAYKLAGNYYNSQWGYQNGKVRNASVSKTLRPEFLLSHIYTPDKNSKWVTSLSYTFGKSGTSGINWNNTLDPHPDYYRYLPDYSYSNGQTATGDRITQQWLSDVNTRQINWDRMINLNRANLYVLPSQLGQQIVTNETRARYIVEDRIEQVSNIGINSVYNKRFNKLFLSAGFNGSIYKSRKYKVLDDLLGSTYWLDYDQFAQNLGVDAMYQQNNSEQPDKKIHKGDLFGYDYAIHINRAALWSQVEYSFQKAEVYAGVTLSDSKTWREGFMANGKFPADSKGLSDPLNFFNYGLKAGITYKLNGRHFITANVSALTRPPATANVFVSPTSRNDTVSGIGSERLFSGDISYLIKYTSFKLRFTYYNTQINNQYRIRTYWDDTYNTNVNLVMKGMNENHQGLELGLEKIIRSSHSFTGAFGLGRFVYSNRPLLDAWQDNNGAALFKDRVAYLKNYKTGGSPQLMAGIGYRYTAKKHWFAGAYVNYVDQIYVELNPDRRTQEALSKFVSTETPVYTAITKQERLPGYAVVNLSGGSSFRINRKYMLNVTLLVSNALNNKTHLVSGYEQLRWDPADITRFANKYAYMPGATYSILVNFNF